MSQRGRKNEKKADGEYNEKDPANLTKVLSGIAYKSRGRDGISGGSKRSTNFERSK